MSNIQFITIIVSSLVLLFGSVELFNKAHQPQQEACIKEGYAWNSLKHMCDSKLKK